MAGIEGIKGIKPGEEQVQRPKLTGFDKNNFKKRLTDEFAAAFTGVQNTANYVKNGGNIFQQAKDTAATSM